MEIISIKRILILLSWMPNLHLTEKSNLKGYDNYKIRTYGASQTNINISQSIENVDCFGLKNSSKSFSVLTGSIESILFNLVSETAFQLFDVSVIDIICQDSSTTSGSLSLTRIKYFISWTLDSLGPSNNNFELEIIDALKLSVSSQSFTKTIQSFAKLEEAKDLYYATTNSLTALAFNFPTSASAVPSQPKSTLSSLSPSAFNSTIIIELSVPLCIAGFILFAVATYFVYKRYFHLKAPTKESFIINRIQIQHPDKESLDREYRTVAELSKSIEIVNNVKAIQYSHILSDSQLNTKNSVETLTIDSVNVKRPLIQSQQTILVPKFKWSDVVLYSTTMDENDAFVGKGSFARVFRARILLSYDVQNTSTNRTKNGLADNSSTESEEPLWTEVVVKVMTESLISSSKRKVRTTPLQRAIEEVTTLLDTESKITYKDCITKVYGICEGRLPVNLCRLMKVSSGCDGVGIIMRYESGGSLKSIIHPKEARFELSITEKLRLLTDIAHGLAEIHTAGIVHGDIKPENILLSGSISPEIRLADFGFASIDDEPLSSLCPETINFRGTPIYCAPEMLVNPYSDQVVDKIAKATRKTDMYAFGILAWELLTGQVPFSDINNHSLLGAKVHQGSRPNIDMIPPECPVKIVEMIESLWQSNRLLRKTAIQCHTILQHSYDIILKVRQDIHFLSTSFDRPVSSLIYKKLLAAGFTGTINKHISEGTEESQALAKSIISQSRFMIVFLTKSLQNDENYIQDMRQALFANRQIIPLFLEDNYQSWISQEIIYLCQLRSSSAVLFDFSASVQDLSLLSCQITQLLNYVGRLELS
jgi:serine/threonine protein kinase